MFAKELVVLLVSSRKALIPHHHLTIPVFLKEVVATLILLMQTLFGLETHELKLSVVKEEICQLHTYTWPFALCRAR